jgi:ubiquinone/menaquinone biosynthesis C-methylase UbiE
VAGVGRHNVTVSNLPLPPTVGLTSRGTIIRAGRLGLPLVFGGMLLRRQSGRRTRAAGLAGLLSVWSLVYVHYRRAGQAQTRHEYALMATATAEAYSRHYNERVPTIEEEFDIWGAYHQHRHEMRYDIVAEEVRRRLPEGGRVLDVGCGSALVADRILDIPATYIGFDYGGHHIDYAAKKMRALEADTSTRLRSVFVRGDGQQMPFGDASIDVVVLSEVIEHLMQPELAVWEIARTLRPGGYLVMTTNNASEVPLRSPISHLFAWLEKALGATHERLISLRPWVWPWPIDRDLLPPGSPDVYIPHTHHIQAQTRKLFASAGLDTLSWRTFEFPPPQAATARWLDGHGERGRRAVDVIEAFCQAIPLLRRLGGHLMMVAIRTPGGGSQEPPPGIWPGPFSA